MQFDGSVAARICVLVLVSGSANAANRFGINGGACAFPKLGQALAVAPPGATIYIAPGHYEVLASAGADGVNLNRDVTLASGTANCAPSAVPSGVEYFANSSSDFTVASGVTAVLDGIDITRGQAGQGGLLHVSHNASLTVRNALLEGGRSTDGGCLYATSGAHVTIDNVIFADCVAVDDGGAVWLDGVASYVDASPDMFDVHAGDSGGAIYALESTGITLGAGVAGSGIHAADAHQGGGLYLEGSDATLEATPIFENTVGYVGAGIAAFAGSTLQITDPDIHDNVATSDGGGILLTDVGTTATIDGAGAGIRNNQGLDGGGLAILSSASLTITDGLVSGNSATSYDGGGAEVIGAASLTLLGSTLFDANTALGGVGGNIVDEAGSYVDVEGSSVLRAGSAVAGGNAYVSSSTFVMKGLSQLLDGTGDGGGIYAIRVQGYPRPVIAVEGSALTLSQGAADNGVLWRGNDGALVATEADVFLHSLRTDSNDRTFAFTDGASALVQNSYLTGNLSGDTVLVADSTFELATDPLSCATGDGVNGEYCTVLRDNASPSVIHATGASTVRVDHAALFHNSAPTLPPGQTTAQAIDLSGSSMATLTDTLVSSNSGGISTASIHARSGTNLVLTDVTFADDGLQIWYEAGSSGTVTSSVVWPTSGGVGGLRIDGSVTGSCTVGTWTGVLLPGATPNLAADPLYVAPLAPEPNLRLLPLSPARDVCGLGDGVDLDSTARPKGAAYDAGAYEAPP